jgi:MFS family permease
MAMAIQQAAGVVSQVIATYLVTTRLGRKWTLVFGLGIAAICLFLFLGAMNFVVLMFASTLFYFFLLMSFAVMYTITPESLPTDVRNFGFGLGSSALSVAMIVAPLLSGALIEGMNLQTGGLIAILIYAASLVLSCVAALWLKETRGISIDEDF